MKSRSYLTCLLIAGIVIVGSFEGCADGARGVRIVLISLDTLRNDSFAGTSEKAPVMTSLRSWAEEATVFTRFYSATSSTQPSHASMFTGLHPWQHGVSRNGIRLSDGVVTVAEKLRQAGFATGAVVASFPVSGRFGFDQGFEVFDDSFMAGEVRGGEWLRAAQEATDEEQTVRPEDPFYSLADEVTERALAQLDKSTARRQFFWFHYFDPHHPYGDWNGDPGLRPRDVLRLVTAGQDPMPTVEEAHRLYDLDVAYLDRSLARVLERLEQDAAGMETHIIVVSDHGESFGEQGSIAHGRRLIPSQIHVPCIIRSPRLAVGLRHDVAGSVDIAPTLLAMAGIEAPIRRLMPARDLAASPGPRSRAMGMRRTYEKPYRDLWLDGTVHVLDEPLFFIVDDQGVIYRGNSKMMMPPIVDTFGVSRENDLKMTKLFSAMEKELSESYGVHVDDPEALKGLRTLGYTD